MIWSNLPDVSASTYISPNCQQYCVLFIYLIYNIDFEGATTNLKDYIYISHLGIVRNLQQGFGKIRMVLIRCLNNGRSYISQFLDHSRRTAIHISCNKIRYVLPVLVVQYVYPVLLQILQPSVRSAVDGDRDLS